MAGVSSRHGKIGIAKQTVKGTPASAPAVVFLLAGEPSLMPVKERGRFPMTDSGRDQGPGYTSGMSVAGDVPIYLHYDGFSLLAYLVLGANADSGGPTDYTHTATPRTTTRGVPSGAPSALPAPRSTRSSRTAS